MRIEYINAKCKREDGLQVTKGFIETGANKEELEMAIDYGRRGDILQIENVLDVANTAEEFMEFYDRLNRKGIHLEIDKLDSTLILWAMTAIKGKKRKTKRNIKNADCNEYLDYHEVD